MPLNTSPKSGGTVCLLVFLWKEIKVYNLLARLAIFTIDCLDDKNLGLGSLSSIQRT